MVNTTSSLHDLVSPLYHYINEIDNVFSHQLADIPVNEFEFIDDSDKEKMFYILQKWDILYNDDHCIRLDTMTFDWFAQKLNVNKIINVADVHDLIMNIRDCIQYSRQDEHRRFKYILKIREMFYSIPRKIRISIDNLRCNIDDTYKQESLFEIKKKELDKLDIKRKAIDDIISQTYILLKEEKDFFYKNGLESRVAQLERILIDYGWEVSELQILIINYLFRVDVQTKKVKKVKKLKLLLDRHVLEVSTDVEAVLAAVQGLPLTGGVRKETKLPLDWLRDSDEALGMLDRVRQDVKYTVERKPKVAAAIEDEYLDREPVYFDIIDYDGMMNGFMVQNQDLLKFICNFPFGKDMMPEDFLEVYTLMYGMYMEKMDFTDEFGIYNDVKYRIIKPLVQ